MSWSIVATSIVAFFAVGVTCLPMDVPATDLMPPKLTREPTLATDLSTPEVKNGPVTELMPLGEHQPEIPEELKEKNNNALNEKKAPAMLFVINVIAVKNSSAEDSNDVLHNDVIDQVPSEIAVPLALFLLVIEDEDENHPVSLDDVAKDLEKEGFAVEKVAKNGETQLVMVDLDSIESTVRVPQEMLEHETEVQDSGKLTSVRRKRHICLHCKLEELKEKIHNKHQGGYGGGYSGCGGGCGGGGGYYPQQVQPVYQPVQVQPVYQPVQVQPVYQPVYQHPRPQPSYYPPQQPQYQPPQQCNTCGGGYGNGGGSSYAQASAQASASSSSGGYGR